MTDSYPVFIVISADDCCQECSNTYAGKVFSTETDMDKIPPLHDDCKCAIAYFKTKELGLEAAKRIQFRHLNNQDATPKEL